MPDIPVQDKNKPDKRLIWVDTVYIDRHDQVFAIVVSEDGSVKTVPVDDLVVCEDAKPMLLLHPEKLQEALRKRMGTQQVMMSPGGMQMQGMSVQRIPAEQIRPGMFSYPGNKPPVAKDASDGEEERED